MDTLRTAFTGTKFQGVQFIPSDLTEGFTRPSIKLDIENIKFEKINSNGKSKIVTIRIYFFATDINEYKIENLQVLEIIENALSNGVRVNDFFIPIDTINSEIIDSVLVVDFDIQLTSFNIKELGENMEDLTLSIK